MTKKISRIVLLVHPFFSFFLETAFAQPIDQKFARPINRKRAATNLKYLAGIWGKTIQQAAQEPETLVVVARPFTPKDGMSQMIEAAIANLSLPAVRSEEWIGFRQLARLLGNARKKLGKRIIEVDYWVNKKSIRNEIKRRGFRLDPKMLDGHSFGELWKYCVQEERDNLEKALRAKDRIECDPRQSVAVLWPKRFSGFKPRKLIAQRKK